MFSAGDVFVSEQRKSTRVVLSVEDTGQLRYVIFSEAVSGVYVAECASWYFTKILDLGKYVRL